MILNPFQNDAFNMVSLTQSINILPNMYGRCEQLNLFPIKGVSSRQIVVEEQNGFLNILPTRPVGSPGTIGSSPKRKVRTFTVPHIPHDDSILPEDYANVRAFGTENQIQTLVGIVNDRLQRMKNKHDITKEYLRMGALKGVILDSDGVTVIYNLFNEFQIKQKSIDFVLGTSTTDVRGKCMELLRHIELSLMGEVMSGVRCLVSPEFFDKLTSHANVKAAYQNYYAAQNMLGGDLRKGFQFGGITWEEYLGRASDIDGNVHKFVPAGEGISFPEGTMDTFRTVCAPADFLDTVGTIGQPYYAKMKVRDFERGVDLHTQSNILPMCARPSLLVRVWSSN
ncbi:MAG: major capsid protein [Desulfobacteraceae bacterium]|nr:major capsid protein [Desulfobacteraceae bacterium]